MTTTTTVDFDGRYSVKTMPGVAFYLLGWAMETREVDVLLCDDGDHDHDGDCGYVETEEYERDDMVRAVMVGDDPRSVHLVDVDDLTLIDPDDYCGGCGQIGCTADGR